MRQGGVVIVLDYRYWGMTRFCLTITQTSLNLPPSPCKLRFIIKSDTSFPNYVSEIPLQKKPTSLFLNQEIPFTIPVLEEQPAVSVYIVGITQEHVMHLGMFVVDLNLDWEGRKKVEGCGGQEGVVGYRILGVEEVCGGEGTYDRRRHNNSSEFQEPQMESLNQSMSYNSINPTLHPSPSNPSPSAPIHPDYSSILQQFQAYRATKEQQINELQLCNREVTKDLEHVQSIHEEMKREMERVKGKLSDCESLNGKLSEMYQVLVAENVELKSKEEGSMGGEEEDRMSIRIETCNRFCQTEGEVEEERRESSRSMVGRGFVEAVSQEIQTEQSIDHPDTPQEVPIPTQTAECSSQTQTTQLPIPSLQLLNSISLRNQKLSILQYLTRIQTLQLNQLQHYTPPLPSLNLDPNPAPPHPTYSSSSFSDSSNRS